MKKAKSKKAPSLKKYNPLPPVSSPHQDDSDQTSAPPPPPRPPPLSSRKNAAKIQKPIELFSDEEDDNEFSEKISKKSVLPRGGKKKNPLLIEAPRSMPARLELGGSEENKKGAPQALPRQFVKANALLQDVESEYQQQEIQPFVQQTEALQIPQLRRSFIPQANSSLQQANDLQRPGQLEAAPDVQLKTQLLQDLNQAFQQRREKYAVSFSDLLTSEIIDTPKDTWLLSSLDVQKRLELFDPNFGDIGELHLGGIVFLTDFVVQVLLWERIDPALWSKQTPVAVKLNGAIHITDKSVRLIAEMVPAIKMMDLTGCRNVTEGSVNFLIKKHSPHLKELHLRGTKVAVIQKKLINSCKALVDDTGCPYILKAKLPPGSKGFMKLENLTEKDNYAKVDTFKVVFVTSNNIRKTFSGLDYLVHKKTSSDEERKYIQANCSYINSTSRGSYKVYEVHETALDLFLSNRAIYVLLYSKASGDGLVQTMAKILSKCPKSEIVLLGVPNSESKPEKFTADQLKLNTMVPKLKKELEDKLVALTKEKKQYFANFGYADQRNAIFAFNLLDALKEENCYRVVNNGIENHEELMNVLQSCETSILTNKVPEMDELPLKFINLMEGMKREKRVFHYAEIVDHMMAQKAPYEKDKPKYKKVLEIMHSLGDLLYWPESELVVTEPDWFGQVLSSIYSSMPKLDIDMDIRAVGPSSHVWPKTKLEAFLKDQLTDQMIKPVIKLLTDTGILAYDSFTQSYFMYDKIAVEPPVPLAHYFPVDSDDFDATYEFNLEHAVPDSIFWQIAGFLWQWYEPSIVWKNGYLFYVGGVDFYIRKGPMGMLLSGRTGKPDENPKSNPAYVEHLWNGVEHFKLIVQYFIHQAGHYVKIVRSGNITCPATVDSKVCTHISLTSRVCDICGMSMELIRKIWDMKSAIQPSFSSLVFTKNNQGQVMNFHEFHTFDGIVNGLIRLEIKFAGNPSSSFGFKDQKEALQFKYGKPATVLDDDPLIFETEYGDWVRLEIKPLEGTAAQGNEAFITELQKDEDLQYLGFKPSVEFPGFRLIASINGEPVLIQDCPGFQSLSGSLDIVQLQKVDGPKPIYDTSRIPEIQKEPIVDGIADVYLQSDEGALTFSGDVTLRSSSGGNYGTLKGVSIKPVNANGEPLSSIPENPRHLLGKPLFFQIQLQSLFILVLTGRNVQNIGVKYKMFNDVKYTTVKRNSDGELNHVRIIKYSSAVNEADLKRLTSAFTRFISYTKEDKVSKSAVTDCHEVTSNRPLETARIIQREFLDRQIGGQDFQEQCPSFCLLPDNIDQNLLLYPSRTASQLSKQMKISFLCNVNLGKAVYLGAHIPNVTSVDLDVEEFKPKTKSKKNAGQTDLLAEIQNFKFQKNTSKTGGIGNLKKAAAYNIAMHSLLNREILPLETDKVLPGITTLSHKQLMQGFQSLLWKFVLSLHGWATNSLGTQSEVLQVAPKLQELEDQFSGLNTACGVHRVDEQRMCLAHHIGFCGADLSDSVDQCNHLSKMDRMPTLHLHANVLGHLLLKNGPGKQLQTDLFQVFTNVNVINLSGNQLNTLPAGLGSCKQLKTLILRNNKLTAFSDDLPHCLEVLDISFNPFGRIPEQVLKCNQLKKLEASGIGLTELPTDLSSLKQLTSLLLNGNLLLNVNGIEQLEALEQLDLSAVDIIQIKDSQSVLSKADFMEKCSLYKDIEGLDFEKLFTSFDTEKTGVLDHNGMELARRELFKKLNRLRPKTSTDAYGFPVSICKLKKLKKLSLNHQGFTVVPEAISELEELEHLDLESCLDLFEISSKMGTLNNIKSLNLQNCPILKTPPKEITSQGTGTIMGYLRRLDMGSVHCRRTKLMLVGLGGAGKTSLVTVLTKRFVNTKGTGFEDLEITDGINIKKWVVKAGCHQDYKMKALNPEVEDDDDDDGDYEITAEAAKSDKMDQDQDLEYSIWDFAGQTVYYNTHQFFLGNRAVYLLLWNIRQGFEHAGLDFWLSSIECHAPRAPVLIIGTHVDEVKKWHIPVQELRERFPQIKGFHYISTVSGKGVSGLCKNLIDVTLQEDYMDEQIPQAWLHFEFMLSREQEKNYDFLEMSKVMTIAKNCGIIDRSEIHDALTFLHALGSIQHFQNSLLRKRVVINPQWIVDAMACVVSVKDTSINSNHGKFYHKCMSEIWSPENLKTGGMESNETLYEWLLHLTEEFDLTFPLRNEEASLVPCLLQEEPPVEYKTLWLDVAPDTYRHENSMKYKFDYLPAGLFNRVQVRLYQYCDKSVIWKKGSLLRKNQHVALLIQDSKDQHTVVVKARGDRPENMLFMIHEVFEDLITEAFKGVEEHYDFFIPCVKCMAVSPEPFMFSAKMIYRAMQLKAPFLQCFSNFHTISLQELHAMMPPDKYGDFDVKMERSIQDLESASEGMETDVFLTYCDADVPKPGKKQVNPNTIVEDLKAANFSVWADSLSNRDIGGMDILLPMQSAKVVIVCVSDEMRKEANGLGILQYAKNILGKKVQLIVLGDSMDWQNCKKIGPLVADDVYVDMRDIAKYKEKKTELIVNLTAKIGNAKNNAIAPKCFISYCWANSRKARPNDTSCCGWGDPRNLKDFIEESGIACWMDTQEVAKGGLYEQIWNGLKQAKVFIACISDEYVKSKNCVMEFRFVSTRLNIPIILAVMGQGYNWETSEICMLAMHAPVIDFRHESPDSTKRLLEYVKQFHPTQEEIQAEIEKAKKQASMNAHNALQEQLELIQRKFLRHILSIMEDTNLEPFPRLFVVDYMTKKEETALENDSSKVNLTKSAEASQGSSSQTNEASSQGTKPDLSKRPTLHRGMSFIKNMTEYRFCFRVLCEHEGGWHTTDVPIPLPKDFNPENDKSYLVKVAPCLARVMFSIKRSPIKLECLKENNEEGRKMVQFMEENCGKDEDFNTVYPELLTFVSRCDERKTYGGLARCHLPTGKILWLCEKHRQDRRIVIMDDLEDIEDTPGTGKQPPPQSQLCSIQ